MEVNIFLNTKFEYAEEDRLTNALMCVLEHSDRSVLNAFVNLVTGGAGGVTAEEGVEFDIQVVFSASRPDARITTSELTLVIETKRYDKLDGDQFRNHWSDLCEAQTPTFLVALTGGRPGSKLVNVLNSDNQNPKLRACHIAWSQVLESLSQHQETHAPESLTGFLVRQLAEYLGALGYDYFKGVRMEDVLEYAGAMAQVERHRMTTGKQIRNLLTFLGERVTVQLGPPDVAVKISNAFTGFKVMDDLDGTWVPFDFLDIQPTEFVNLMRFRIVPYVVLPEDMLLRCYLTYSRGVGPDPLSEWLVSHEASIREEVGPVDELGFINKSIYHVTRSFSFSKGSPVLAGDELALNQLGEEIGSFFLVLRRWASRAIVEQSA